LPGEYIEWITEAKRGAARAQRLATTIQWLAEGKPFTGNTQLLSFAVAGQCACAALQHTCRRCG